MSKRLLYIGTLAKGGTSEMRSNILQSILSYWQHEKIDLRHQFRFFDRFWQAIGFRWKIGLLPYLLNKKVLKHLKHSEEKYDLVWVDKAIHLSPKTTHLLKQRSEKLVHYTPDAAFFANRSAKFIKSMNWYDFVITTKSFEIPLYQNHVDAAKVLLCTQGYNARLHQKTDTKKVYDIAFVGLCESSREHVLQLLLNEGFKVVLAGVGWGGFLHKNRIVQNLSYQGVGVFGTEYVHLLNQSVFGWGALSKKFPELHTTRTFEIPACGTILLTERNVETVTFFKEDEAVFYESTDDLVEKIKCLLRHSKKLTIKAEKGCVRVSSDGRDYESIMRGILTTIQY